MKTRAMKIILSIATIIVCGYMFYEYEQSVKLKELLEEYSMIEKMIEKQYKEEKIEIDSLTSIHYYLDYGYILITPDSIKVKSFQEEMKEKSIINDKESWNQLIHSFPQTSINYLININPIELRSGLPSITFVYNNRTFSINEDHVTHEVYQPIEDVIKSFLQANGCWVNNSSDLDSIISPVGGFVNFNKDETIGANSTNYIRMRFVKGENIGIYVSVYGDTQRHHQQGSNVNFFTDLKIKLRWFLKNIYSEDFSAKRVTIWKIFT